MRRHRADARRLVVAAGLVAPLLFVGAPRSGEPRFRIEDRTASSVWADPRAGVWWQGSSWLRERPGIEADRAAVTEGWGRGGWLYRMLPLLRDDSGRLWFRMFAQETPFVAFDGRRWIEPRPPKEFTPDPLRWHRDSLNQLDDRVYEPAPGVLLAFDSFGAMALREEEWVGASFYDLRTYDRGAARWPHPQHLHVFPRFAAAPDGSVIVWGRLSASLGQPAVDKLRFLRWTGRAWEGLESFRGVKPDRLMQLALLPNGGAWLLLRDGNETLPVFVAAGESLDEAGTILRDEDGDAIELPPRTSHLTFWLFQEEDTVYVKIDRLPFALLPNGKVRALSEEDWPSNLDYLHGGTTRSAGGSLWFLFERMLYRLGTDGLRAIPLPLRGDPRLRGFGPDGRAYILTDGGAVVSLLPDGEERPPPLVLESVVPPGLDEAPAGPLRLDSDGHIVSWAFTPHRLWPATHRFGPDGWETVWDTRPPPPPDEPESDRDRHKPRYYVGPPPRNFLETLGWHDVADTTSRIDEHLPEVYELLRSEHAPYYRSPLTLIEPGHLVLAHRAGHEVFDGSNWHSLADLFARADERYPSAPAFDRKTLERGCKLLLRGPSELWLLSKGVARSIVLADSRGVAPRPGHIIQQLPEHPGLGRDTEGVFWDFSRDRPPIRLARVDPAVLAPDRYPIRLGGIDESGRVYYIEPYVGKLSVTDTKGRRWSFDDVAFENPNSTTYFATDASGRIWAGTAKGLLVFAAPEPGKKVLELLRFDPRYSRSGRRRLQFDRFGNLWMGWDVTRGAGHLPSSRIAQRD